MTLEDLVDKKKPNFEAYPCGNGFPLTYQNTEPHKDELWGRSYVGQFEKDQLCTAGNNIVIGGPKFHKDHWDIIELNIDMNHMYHNRIYPEDPGLEGILKKRLKPLW